MASYVRGTAVSASWTGLTDEQWMQQARSVRFVARFAMAEHAGFNLDLLVEFGLQRLLDAP